MYPPEADPLPEPAVEEAPWKNDRNLLRRKKKRDAVLNLNIPHPQQWKKNDDDNNNNRRSLQLCQDIGEPCGYYGCACTNATKIMDVMVIYTPAAECRISAPVFPVGDAHAHPPHETTF